MSRQPSLRARLAEISPRRLVLFLDYDGTLTPIVWRPGDARLKAGVRRMLRRLARRVPVVIVSGRSLADLQKRMGISGIRYVASHGLVFKEPSAAVRWMGRRIPRSEVQEWIRALESAIGGIPGALVEDKWFSVALHNRMVRPADRGRLRRRALHALASWLAGKKVTLVRGKCVLEVRPAGSWNKGTAVVKLLKRRWARGRLPVYFGDDRTDFDAFRAVRGRGLAVRVGGRRGVSGEDAWVSGPKAVESLLHWLAAKIEGVERTVH